MYSYQQALLLRPRTLRMVVLVTTRLRAALEMTRVARVRVVGERSGCAPPNDILSANISAVINNVIRLFIFSPPFSFRQSKTDRLSKPTASFREEVAGCATGSARLS